MARINDSIYQQIPTIDKDSLNNIKSLIVIVDMVNGFVRTGNMADSKIGDIIPAHLQLFERLPLASHLYFVDAHLEDCQEFKSFPVHCLKDSIESQIVDELKVDSEKSRIVHKNSTNGFLAPDFYNYLDEYIQYEQFIITGCCSDICVLQFALSLQTYIHEFNLEKKVWIVIDAIDTYHNDMGHDVVAFNEISYQLLKAAGIQFIRLKEGKE